MPLFSPARTLGQSLRSARFFSTEPPSFQASDFAHLLRQCRSLPVLRSIHQQILVRGLASIHSDLCLSLPPPSQSLGTSILSAYVAHGARDDAVSMLLLLNPSSDFWWNTLIKEDVRQGHPGNVLHICCHMQCIGKRPDWFALPFVLKACGELGSFGFGTSVHASSCKGGLDSDTFVLNALISLYGRCGVLRDAMHVFEETIAKGAGDVISWNSIVGACVRNGCVHLALDMFRSMTMCVTCSATSGFRPDAVSLVNVLPACSLLRELELGRQVHCFALRSGLIADVFVGNAILDMYAKCGMMSSAQRAFDIMETRDVVSWNAMVTGYLQSGNFDRALSLFKKMREANVVLDVVTWSALISGYAQGDHVHEAIGIFREMQFAGVEPNAITLISLLSACASMSTLLQGKETHGYAIRRCILDSESHGSGELLVHNALVDMYSKCKRVSLACSIFNATPMFKRDVVTWTAMIGGYAQHGDANSALKIFSEMLLSGTCSPNDFTIACVLIACVRLSTLHLGKQLHAFVIRHFCDSTESFIANCLIDMYSKCGDIDAAERVFNGISRKDDVSWTSLITGYGMHGHIDDALHVFKLMQEMKVVPDAITVLVVLYACSHAGLVEEGMRIFHNMGRDFGLIPTVEHYACAVDLLGRASRLQEAKALIDSMPVEPTIVIWVSFLNACRIHANVEFGEIALRKLSDMNYEGDGSYMLLSNIYADAERWKDVARIQDVMKKAGVKKRPGCSWIQGKKGASTFKGYWIPINDRLCIA